MAALVAEDNGEVVAAVERIGIFRSQHTFPNGQDGAMFLFSLRETPTVMEHEPEAVPAFQRVAMFGVQNTRARRNHEAEFLLRPRIEALVV